MTWERFDRVSYLLIGVCIGSGLVWPALAICGVNAAAYAIRARGGDNAAP